MKCLCRGFVYLACFLIFLILPVVGLVFTFFLGNPGEFLLTSIAISVLWISLGVGVFLTSLGLCKCCPACK